MGKEKKQIFVLLFQCKDKKGIVAAISDFIYRQNGNIITADQHSTGLSGGDFFMRVEFVSACSVERLEKGLSQAARKFRGSFKLYKEEERPRMGIMVSHPDHCLFDLLYLWRAGELKVRIPFVVSNYEGHKELVERFGAQFYFIPAGKKDRREAELLALAKEESDFLVLARYMLVLSSNFLRSYGKDIINIHHGFLPSFKGAHPYRQALDRGVKVIGATAHFVNDRLDAGPIIAQVVEGVTHKDDLSSLIQKGRRLENQALSSALFSYIDHRVIRKGNKTIVF